MQHLFVDTREGPAFASIPTDVVATLESAAGDEGELERGLVLVGLVLVRAGREGGEALLRHLIAHDPGLLLRTDPRLAETLAHEPELIVGPLAGT